MIAEANSLQAKLQDVVRFLEGVPDTVASLDTRLEAITTWLAANQLSDVASKLPGLQGCHDTLQENVDRRLRELTAEFQHPGCRTKPGGLRRFPGFCPARPRQECL